VGPATLRILLRAVLGWERTLQIASGVCLGALAILSLLPANQVVRTDLGGHLEHVIGYAGTSFLCTAGWRGGAEPWLVFFALLAYAGALEFMQRFAPGRLSSLIDFIFSGSGVLIGVLALTMVKAWACAHDSLS
jgi:VanZ family protein